MDWGNTDVGNDKAMAFLIFNDRLKPANMKNYATVIQLPSAGESHKSIFFELQSYDWCFFYPPAGGLCGYANVKQ